MVLALAFSLVTAAIGTFASEYFTLSYQRPPCRINALCSAGQECPNLMGLPMGLGGGFKWSKDDDEKE